VPLPRAVDLGDVAIDADIPQLIFGDMAASSSETRDGFSFRGDHPALDLCATLTARATPTPRDLLASPRDLGRWLKAAGLARTVGRATSDDLELARSLREAIYALASPARRLPAGRAAS
jgi:hypothetical protein